MLQVIISIILLLVLLSILDKMIASIVPPSNTIYYEKPMNTKLFNSKADFDRFIERYKEQGYYFRVEAPTSYPVILAYTIYFTHTTDTMVECTLIYPTHFNNN